MRQTPEQRAAQARIDENHRQACEVARHVATRYLRLFELCHRPGCRRARACVGPGAPACIIEQKRHYQHLLPDLHRAAMARLDELRAAGEADGGADGEG